MGVVDRWQDYGQHLGGITNNGVSDTEIYFSGGFNSPSSGYEKKWTFIVSRLTGNAQLNESGQDETSYQCSKVSKKF